MWRTADWVVNVIGATQSVDSVADANAMAAGVQPHPPACVVSSRPAAARIELRRPGGTGAVGTNQGPGVHARQKPQLGRVSFRRPQENQPRRTRFVRMLRDRTVVSHCPGWLKSDIGCLCREATQRPMGASQSGVLTRFPFHAHPQPHFGSCGSASLRAARAAFTAVYIKV